MRDRWHDVSLLSVRCEMRAPRLTRAPGLHKRLRVQQYKAERHVRIAVALSRLSAAVEEP